MLAIGAVYAWQYRFYVNPDGVAYLDLADRIRAHGWSAAINAHWSPLLPWLFNLVRIGGAYYESTVAHSVTFLMYCLAFAAFEFLLRELRRDDAAFRAIAYALFVWACNCAAESGPAVLSPDLFVAAELFFASALLVQVARGDRDWWTYIALGASLGVGYLAKAPMMPLGVCILAVAAILGGRRSLPRAAVSAALMLLVGSLYFVPLSKKLGRVSIGDSGRHNYIWFVAFTGTEAHPVQVLYDDPRLVGFPPPPEGGTYALHDDPGYWVEGKRPHFVPGAQFAALWTGVKVYLDVLRLPLHLALLIVFLLLLFGADDRLAALRRHWYLVVPSLAALAMYAAVLVQVRYVGPSIAILWIALFAALDLGTSVAKRAVAAAGIAAVIAILGTPEIRSDIHWLLRRATPEDWLVARSLSRAGLKPGDRVAFVGPAFTCYWARLAKVTVVAETDEAAEFWNADDDARDGVQASLRRFGVRALVAIDAPDDPPPCFQPVSDTRYSVCLVVQ